MKRFFKNTHGAGTSNDQGQGYELPIIESSTQQSRTSEHTEDQIEDPGFKEFAFKNCENISKAIQFLGSSSVSRNLAENETISLIKFEIFGDFSDLNAAELTEISHKCIRNSVVLFFASKCDEKFSIYWKSYEIESLLTFRAYNSEMMRINRALFEFIVKFLIMALKNKHLGLRKFDNKHRATEFELHFLADHREYNILLVAAEMDDLAMVKMLIKLNIETESPFKNINAQSLAYNEQHFEVLLFLLNENLTFPFDMDVSKCSNEVQEFFRMALKFHEYIKTNNVDEITKMIQKYPNLRYFFNELNESASAVALQCNHLEVYEVLMTNGICFAAHEKTEAIMEALEYETQRAVREIHFKNSKEITESHMNILMANSSVSHDALNPKELTSYVQEAFNILNAIPLIRIILMVVAASRKFKIIFDFNRDTVHFADPTSGSYTNGIFYTSGRIYIGAKQLLQQATKNEVLGTLAHELCHYALNLIFSNDAKPYAYNDNLSMQEFEDISKYCEENSKEEEIVDLVYRCYPEDMYHAELAVRVPHLLALYHGLDEKLQKVRDIFGRLFEFIEEKVAPKMAEAIPDVESKVDREIEEKDLKISKLTRKYYLAIVFGIITALLATILVGYYFYKPTYKFGDLSESQQNEVKNGKILYKNIEVRFVDLFPGNSTVFDKLASDDISKLLNSEILNLGDSHLRFLEEKIFFEWENMAEKLKEKFLNSDIIFQGKIVILEDLVNEGRDILKYLSSKQIKQALNGVKIEIGIKPKSEAKVYVQRKFIPEDAQMLWFEYEFGHNYNGNLKKDVNVEVIYSNETFQEFLDKFLTQSFAIRSRILYQVSKNVFFKNRFFDLNYESFHIMYKNSTGIIEQVDDEKIFILSSEAGAGKTVTFKDIVMEIKEIYPTYWVSYIDLKKHSKLYQSSEIVENVQELLRNVTNVNMENKFEVKIFEESYKSGKMILLWNGFDEVASNHIDFVLALIKDIHKDTKIIQLVNTRPLYSKELSKSFKTRPWQLVPLDENEKREFLRNIFASQNSTNDKIDQNIEKSEEIIRKFQFNGLYWYRFQTALMMKLVTETIEDSPFYSPNMYKILNKFVDRKVEIWLQKTGGPKTIRNVNDLDKIYQKYALLDCLHLYSFSTMSLKLKQLKIMQKDIPQDLSYEDISRIGILLINSKNDFKFAHKTFSEFFVAQYFIEGIYNAENNIDSDDVKLRLDLFFLLAKDYGHNQGLITDIMKAYLQLESRNEHFSTSISQLLRTKYRNYLFRLLDTNYPKIFEFFFDFFQKDHSLLADLLHVDKDETLYTAIFDPNHFALFADPEEIKKLGKKYLNEVEFQKFITGKNQKGKIILGMRFYKMLGISKVHDFYKIGGKNLNRTTYWDYFDEVEDNFTKIEQKELFITVISPKIYLFYDKIFNISDFFEYQKIWDKFENLLEENDHVDVFGNALIQYYEISPDNKTGHELYFNFLMGKAKKFLSNSQFYEMILSKNILHETQWDADSMKVLWTILKNSTNSEQRKKILLQDGDDSENLYLFFRYSDDKESYSSHKYVYYYYDLSPFKIIHRSLTRSKASSFNLTKEIYYENFNKNEIQEIITNSYDFILYPIVLLFEERFKEFVAFLEELFKGNETLLVEYLERTIRPTDLNVFEYVNDFKELPFSILKWFKNLEKLTNLYIKFKRLSEDI